MNVRAILDAAAGRLGPERKLLLDYLATCGAVNLEWYLQQKIVKLRDPEQQRDNERVLKYAYHFCLRGAKVTFLQESSDSGVKTPDLKVETDESRFLLEVKKFRSQVRPAPGPVLKIVGAVKSKRQQLPASEIGFVAIDNFDLGLEEDDESGLSHKHITEALCELDRLAAADPSGWDKPSGVVLAASTTGGAVNVVEGDPPGLRIPHFVWTNEHGKPSAPEDLAQWLESSLPDGRLFDPAAMCSEPPVGTEL